MKLLLVGVGGYGSIYAKILLDHDLPNIVWEGVVDPFYSACQYKEQIDAANIPVYDTMEAFYSNHSADLVIISTPTYLHAEQSICALSHGSNVLCEKPAAPTIEEAMEMIRAEKKYGRFIAIGYQWSYSDAIQALKADILNGVLGKPKFFKTVISWPRNRDYYQRGSGWAGKIKKDGRMILDSIASNACAHYLHNMFFLLGDTMETSATVTEVQAECYRANDIENFDTCCIKMKTQDGTNLYFAATHAAKQERNPEFVYVFENAKVVFSQDDSSLIVAEFHDGSKKIYGNPTENDLKKLQDCVEASRNKTVPICTVKTALPHIALIETIYQTTPIFNFPQKDIYQDDDKNAIYVRDLYAQVCRAYEQGVMFSEINSTLFAR